MKRWADAERARDAATLLPFAAAILFLPPFILLFAAPVAVAGVPLIVVYIFAVWAVVVLAAWVVARSRSIVESAPHHPAEDEAEVADRSAPGHG